ncbi:MAG: hypothetical protein ACRCXL_07000 [Dermatophilaceae bacterium]
MTRSDELPRLSSRLEHLFATVPNPQGTRYTVEAVVRELGQRGITVTATHLQNMKAGRARNPSARLVGGLAEVFGVPVGYFYDEDEERRVNEQLAALTSLRQAQVSGLVLRGGLDATTLLEIAAMVRAKHDERP